MHSGGFQERGRTEKGTILGTLCYSPVLNGTLRDLTHSVKAQRLEGLIAKRSDSKYEPGLRSGAWLKMRVNQGQEFVIGGYTPSLKNFDALVIGYYDGARLIYAARTRNGFYASLARSTIQEAQAIRNRRMSVYEPAGKEGWPVGRGADCSEDGRVPLAATTACRPIRVRRVDGRRPLAA